MTSGSMTEPPARPPAGHARGPRRRRAGPSAGTPARRRRPAGARRRSLVGVLRQHHDADAGMVGADGVRRLDPLHVVPGGMRMSVMTASGEMRRTASCSSSAVPTAASDLDRAGVLQQPAGALADEVVVLGEHDPQRVRHGPVRGAAARRAAGARARPAVDPRRPPSASTRSRELVRPVPRPGTPKPVRRRRRRSRAPRRWPRSSISVLARIGVLQHVGERLADHEVGRCPRRPRGTAAGAGPPRRGRRRAPGADAARASTAATRPLSLSTGGWMPCASSRSSVSSSRTSACISASSGAGDSPLHLVARQAELGDQRDHLLLGAVVDVPLDAAAFGVLRAEDPVPGPGQLAEALGQLRGEADVRDRRGRLAAERGEQLPVLAV